MAVSTEKRILSDGVIDARYLAKFQRRQCSFAICSRSWLDPDGWAGNLLSAAMGRVVVAGSAVACHRHGRDGGLPSLLHAPGVRDGSSVRMVLAILGSMSAQGPLVAWVSTHRRHHQLSDREGDPHSPNLNEPGFRGRLKGIWHAHFGWMPAHAPA